MPYEAILDGRETALDIVGRRPELQVAIDGAARVVQETPHAANAFEIAVDGQVFRGWRYAVGAEVHIRLGGRTFLVQLPEPQSKAHAHGRGDDEIRAEMPGTMIAVHCAPGQDVHSGDRLVTMESMKLQLTLAAPRDGVIEAVHVPPETAFERGALLVSLVPIAAAGGKS